MTLVFVLEAGEVIHNTSLFQSILSLFSWHKGLVFVLEAWELIHNTLLFQFMFPPFSWHKLLVFVVEAGEVLHNNLSFQSMFLLFPWHKWLLFSFWKKGKLFNTLCYFNPCFCFFQDINDFGFRSGRRGSYSSHFAISFHVFSIFLK